MQEKKKGIVFLQYIIKYYKIEWRYTLILLGLMLIIVACGTLLPLLTFQMTQSIMLEANALPEASDFFWGLHYMKIIYISIAVVVIQILTSFVFNYVGFLMGRKIEISLRNESLEALVRQDISYYSDKKIGELLTHVVSDTQMVGDQASLVPMLVGVSVGEVLAAIGLMFFFEPLLATIATVVMFLILATMTISMFFINIRYHKIRKVVTDINGNVIDRIATVRLIKATGTENFETERFKKVHEEYYDHSKKVAKLYGGISSVLFGGVAILNFATVIGAILIYGARGNDQVAEFFGSTFASFTLAQQMLIGPLFSIMNASFGLTMATVSAVRVEDMIKAPSIMEHHYFDGLELDEINGEIKLKGVQFEYPEKPGKVILPKFDFTFEAGKSYAFVGQTGSGKTTISKLLLRFYDPTQGQVLINGKIDLKDVKLATYLKHVGYVEQDPQILYGDVYENVRYGVFDATNEQVIAACKKAELHSLIETWPQGYDTVLGERGFMLSGGQKQRLIIARMFLKDPKILILDEATSALDNIVEKEIQAKLEDLMKGRTTVSIAHRLSTIKNADHIVVLGANGVGIVQTGTFDELKNKPGHFQNLYKAGLMA